MGTVYRARDRETGQTVAVKLLRGARDDDLARFRREAVLLAEIDHPHIVKHLASGLTDEGQAYLVMEWVEGGSLRERLRTVGLPLGESVHVVRDVAAALATVHARGIVHRDIKPSNILFAGGLEGS